MSITTGTNNIAMSYRLTREPIDLALGEASIIRENFVASFGLENQLFTTELCPASCAYPPPKGHAPLVKMLEDIHEAPVIICNGAKQALAAVMYSMLRSNKKFLGYKSPYWSYIPQLAARMGLKSEAVVPNDMTKEYCDCYLGVEPNNPCGAIDDYITLKFLADAHKSFGIPFIHDAAYYTPVYLPDDYHLGPLGNVQIFSISKMYGLSGLRLGYVVAYDAEIYQHVLDYMEHMTVGVSVPSQEIMCEVLQAIKNNPADERKFVVRCRNDLYKAKFFARTINQNIIEVPDNVEHTVGMFLWAKVKNKLAFENAKVNVAWGAGFGNKDYVRINLAAPIEKLTEAISRLNECR